GKVEEAHVLVWNGVRIMRGTPSPDGPQGSFEKIDVSGAQANKVARERIAMLRAEGFEEIVDAPKPQRAAAPRATRVSPAARAPQAPSKARPAVAPAWTKRLSTPAGEAIARQLAKLRKALAKVGLDHRAREIESLARPGIDFAVKKAKTVDPKSVVSRIGGAP